MNISIEDVNETRKNIVVTVATQEVMDQEQEILKSYQKSAKIKGFRPGKAPIERIQSQYAKDLKEDLKRRVTGKAYDFMMEGASINIYQVVDINAEDVTSANKAVISFLVDVSPLFDLPDYKGVTVVLPEVSITEEEREKAIEHMRNQRAEFKVVEEAAEKGDYVKVSYEGKIDGMPIEEIAPGHPIYAKQAMTWEEAGAENVPGVRAVIDGVIGMKAGDSKEEEMTYPADFKVAELAGKKAVYSLAVEEVRKKVMPELDEVFFKALEVGNLEELHEKVEAEFKQHRKHEGVNKAREQIVNHLVKEVSFAVPESAVDMEAESILRSHMTRLIKQGVPMNEFEKHREQLIEEARRAAEEAARVTMILEAIAKAESIEIKNEDLNMVVLQEAMAVGVRPEEFVKELKGDQPRIQELRRKCLINKVLDFLYKEARIENTGVSS